MSKNNKFEWGGIHPFSHHPFIFHNIPDLKNKVVVDAGCGKGIWSYLMRTTRDFGRKGKLYGIDVKSSYRKFCSKRKVYDRLYSKSISKLPFADNSVDFLISSEVIEHLEKKDGQQFLKEVDRVLKDGRRAIISTPHIDSGTKIDSGPDSHKYIWSIDEFKEKGYGVKGMGIRIPLWIEKWYTAPILILGHIATPFTYNLPIFSGYLISIKDY